jgi:hypothetical protein
MDCVFINVPMIDDRKVPVKNTAFNITWDRFEKISARGLNLLEEKKIFKIESNKCIGIRRRNEYKQTAVEAGRNINSFRLSRPSKASDSFEDGTIIILIRPHKYFYHRRPKESHMRFVYNFNTNCFIIMSYDEYKASGISRFGRGQVIERKDGEWKRLGGTSKVVFKDRANDLDVNTMLDEVGENLMKWKNKSKVTKLCGRCKKTCKQFEWITSITCPVYDPIKPRKKRELVDHEMISDLEQHADLGEQLKKKVPKKRKPRNANK